MFGGQKDHARPYRAKRPRAAARHQGAPPRHLRGGMGESLHGGARGWAGPRFYSLQSGYRISAGRGRTGGLEEAEESRGLGGGGPLYTITLRGIEMLREV